MTEGCLVLSVQTATNSNWEPRPDKFGSLLGILTTTIGGRKTLASQSEMQERDPVPDVPDGLRRAMEASQVVPFVGAGISMGAHLENNRRMPSYKELLMAIFRRAEENDRFSSKRQRDRCLRLIETGPLMKGADILDEVLNKRDLYLYLREELNHLQPKPSLVHELLNVLNFNMILTSNYDRLLECSLYPTPEVMTYRDRVSISILTSLAGDSKPVVFKIHGDLTRPETIVLGYSAYKKLHTIHTKDNAPLQTFMGGLLQHKTLLFLGCSFAGGEYAEYFSDFLGTYDVEPSVPSG